LSLGAFVAINPRLRWFLSAALREVKNPASGEADQPKTKAYSDNHRYQNTRPFMMTFRIGENTGPIQNINKSYPSGNTGKSTYVQYTKKANRIHQITMQKLTLRPK